MQVHNSGTNDQCKLSLIQYGMQNTPPYVQQVLERNRTLWQLSSTDPKEFQRQQNIWIQEIAARLTDLRGNPELDPQISIIIPVRNEEEHLLATLDGIASQRQVSRVEVVLVVNNNDKKDLSAILGEKCGCRVLEYRFSSKKLKPISLARQYGLISSKGEYILTSDADAIAQPQWVHKLIQPLRDDDQVGMTTSHSRLYEWELDKKVKENDHQRVTTRELFEWTGFIGLGNNMAFRRSDAEKLGGYNLSIYPGEDTEIGVRLSILQQKKSLLLKDDDATVWLSPRRVLVYGAEFILHDWLFMYKDSSGQPINVRDSYKKLMSTAQENTDDDTKEF